MKKKERQAIIKKLFVLHRIESQEELMNLLKKENVSATQATISRDMREMNIAKTYAKNGRPYYSIFESKEQDLEDRIAFSMYEYLKKITQIDFLVVVHTAENGADVIANYLDEMELPEIVGTIAGFDILLIITPSQEAAAEGVERVNHYVEGYEMGSSLFTGEKNAKQP